MNYYRMKKIPLILGFLSLPALGFSQSADRNSLGFFTIAGYPYCQMECNSQTSCIVTDHIVPIQYGSSTSYIKNALNIACSYITDVYSPDGADIVVAVNDFFENQGKITYYDAKEKRPAPRNESRQSTTIKIGSFTLSTGSSAPKPTPPPAEHQYVARATKEVGFTIEVKFKNQLVFTDTIYSMQEFESNAYPNKKMAEDQLVEMLKGFNLSGQMKAYEPFLSKVVGATALTSLNFKVYGVKVRKKCTVDYSDINAAYDNFEKAFDYLKKRQWEIDDFKEKAASSVAVWQKAIEESKTPNSRISTELCAAMYYNMAVYSALCKDFTASVDYFKLSDKTLVDFGDALRMSKLAQTWVQAKENYETMMKGN